MFRLYPLPALKGMRAMSDRTVISPEGQITIPESVREALGWKPGQELAFVPEGNSVVLVRVPEFQELLGILPDADPIGYRDRNDRH
ncbi:MAG TPA: AbrB/MazE/SpoVT family DNA-binding domain-containing protein [Mesorhizobium sp.]|jgi:AbrB family looped-hinge helix DNA binding protein|nr:AbrB/MazE/SpoVT family DNA-binding domain-containing protein [Mesorhizobium sp.]